MIFQQLPPGLTQTKDAKQHLFKFHLDFSGLLWSLNKHVSQNLLSHKNMDIWISEIELKASVANF